MDNERSQSSEVGDTFIMMSNSVYGKLIQVDFKEKEVKEENKDKVLAEVD